MSACFTSKDFPSFHPNRSSSRTHKIGLPDIWVGISLKATKAEGPEEGAKEVERRKGQD